MSTTDETCRVGARHQRDNVAASGLSTAAIVNVITVAAVALFWLISTSWQPWNLFARAGFSADFYDEQARVFLRGRLAVDPAVPGPEGFLIDGRTYLYYGPFLSIVRMPFQLFGDVFTSRLVRVSMLIAVVVMCRWAARLARAGRQVVNPVSDTDRWAVGVFTAAVAFSPALFAAGWISVYNETELWAFTLALVAVTLIVEWAATGFTDDRALVGASAAALAATLTRAPIGLGVAFVIGVCGIVLAWRSRPQARGGRHAGAAAGMAAGVAGWRAPPGGPRRGELGQVRDAVLGARREAVLSLQDPWRAEWFAGNNDSFFSTRFLTTTIVQYLRPDAIRFERLIPGVRFGPVAQNRSDYPLLGNTPASSLTLTATLLAVLAVFGVVWLLRHRAKTWLLVVVGTTLGALPTFAIGFLANRYLIDMLPPLVAAGAIGIWVIADRPSSVGARRAVRIAAVVLVGWGVWVNASLATWTLEQKSAGFTDLRYEVDGWIFPDPAPGLVVIDPEAAVARDGVVGLDIDEQNRCLGVYTAEQGVWVTIDGADTDTLVPRDGDTAGDSTRESDLCRRLAARL